MGRKIFSKEERQEVWNKCNKRCAYCGCLMEYRDMQIDHIIPFRNQTPGAGYMITIQDGKIEYDVDDYKNLNPACRVCNNRKMAMTVDLFREEIQMQVLRLNQRSSGFRLAIRYDLIEPTHKKVEFYFETLT